MDKLLCRVFYGSHILNYHEYIFYTLGASKSHIVYQYFTIKRLPQGSTWDLVDT